MNEFVIVLPDSPYQTVITAQGPGCRGINSVISRTIKVRFASLLRRGDGAAVVDAGAVFPSAADWLLRGHRRRARYRVAGGGLAGTAPFSELELSDSPPT